MRSMLIRVEHEKRRLLAVATGLGVILLWIALVRKDEPPSQRSHTTQAGSASRAASGSTATRANGAEPPGRGVHSDEDPQAALDSADRYKNNGDYLGCVRELPTWKWTRSRLSEEMEEAIWLKRDDCTRRARWQAGKAVRAKDYPAAIALLEPLVDYLRTGNHGTVTVDGGWLLSDLAFAYERNRQYVECIQLLTPLGVLAEEGWETLIKATDYNRDRCHKRLAARYAIHSGGCRISIDGAIASAAAPPALIPRGTTAACVALVPGKRPPDLTEYDPEVCPVVTLVWRGAKGVVRKDLPSEGDDALDSDFLCRNLSSIAVGTMAGKGVVRVGGDTQNCSSGCKNISSIDVFYEWNGQVLTPVLDLTY